ncbi:MAG TPA: aspartate-semialdehyde dehydrogenase [Gemmatimonadaceae bacterium]|nr:aspartate-semialdehyde dehydrogenase [Gemmatimonadaceae bacterium]
MTLSEPNGMSRIPVAVLGATGAVGQTFIRLLADHPWFTVAEVAASERSAGKTYRDAVQWLEGDLPADVARLTVRVCDPGEIQARVVFSALDSSVAGDIEAAFAQSGAMVLSNAKNFRMAADVPLVIPEVNAAHLALLSVQRAARGWPTGGGIVTNANCAATVAAMALAPLHEAFGVRRVFVVTLQAVSGAGYPGVPSLDALGNVIPYIADEEPKLERELNKMLGRFDGRAITPAPFAVSAQVNRVAVEHGHLTCLAVELTQAAPMDEIAGALQSWSGDPVACGLPSSPARPLAVTTQPDRPQSRRDVGAGRGMTVTVGRLRPDPLFHVKYVALGHNTIRGAAGGSILNAEVLVRQGVIRA